MYTQFRSFQRQVHKTKNPNTIESDSLCLSYLSLALIDDNTLLIGSVDQIQMLHIQTIPLGETAR